MPEPMTERAAEALSDDFERDLHTEHQILNMGPSHPATHGTVKFLIELDGETIVNLDVQVGYLHRGFEKECESHGWHQAIPYTDRLNYNSAILSSTAFCLAVEKLLQIEAPRRGQWLRVLAGELARVADHLTRCGTLCLDLGAATPADTDVRDVQFVVRRRSDSAKDVGRGDGESRQRGAGAAEKGST